MITGRVTDHFEAQRIRQNSIVKKGVMLRVRERFSALRLMKTTNGILIPMVMSRIRGTEACRRTHGASISEATR
jgi:hypothetical protein